MVARATTRSELVRRLVLSVICDDYENLAVSIEMPVVETGGRCGLYIEKAEIVRALRELIELGWAKAYYLGDKFKEIEGMPPEDELEDPDGPWFYGTDEGLKVQLGDSEWWPFDEDKHLLKDWTPPEN